VVLLVSSLAHRLQILTKLVSSVLLQLEDGPAAEMVCKAIWHQIVQKESRLVVISIKGKSQI